MSGPPRHAPRRARPLHADWASALLSLLLLLAWDASGWDLAAMRLMGDGQGFPWRDAFATSTLLHGGGRALALCLFGGLAIGAWRATTGPSRSERTRWLGASLLCAVAVPLLKQFSLTSCPWDLAQFHGVARHVSHWRLGVADGGPGHCFPSGHAVAAFAFFSQYFLWRRHDGPHARRWLTAVLGLGLAFGLGQWVRGAHYPSHTLWSAWLCWVICAVADRWRPPRTA